MSGEILKPSVIVVPKVAEATRDLMVAEIGTLIYNTDTDKLNFCVTAAAGAGNWEAVTSV